MASDLDAIVDYDEDGEPIRFADILAAVAKRAERDGLRLVISDGDNPTFMLTDK